MSFPNPPFVLRNDDRDLIQYLKWNNASRFTFLDSKTRTKINKIEKTKDGFGAPLRGEQEFFLVLWGDILRDALSTLKQRDTREWDADPTNKIDFKSFFHAGSLGITQLRDVLSAFADFESLLYGASPERYRDHIAHVFRVWVLGHGILKNRLKWDLHIPDKTSCPLDIHPEEWECLWAIVALCHDLGYPLAAVEKINQKARVALRDLGLIPSGDLRFVFSQQMLPFHDTVIRLMSSKPVIAGMDESGAPTYLTHLQNKYYLKFLKSFDVLEHGVISSLLLCKSLVYFLESDLAHDDRVRLNMEDARQFLMRREVLRAIAAHTCLDIYHLRFDTLSFVLFMLDELQGWGRPTLEELQRGEPRHRAEPTTSVDEFSREKIAITVETPDPRDGRDSAENSVRNQFNNLHRILRLAVDRPRLTRELYLEFNVHNTDTGDKARFIMKKGKIQKLPKRLFK